MLDLAHYTNHTCLGCGLPGVASYCDECIDWQDDNVALKLTPVASYEIEVTITDVVPGSPSFAFDPPGEPPIIDSEPPDPLPPLPVLSDPDEDSPPIGPDPERCRNCGGAHHIQECSEILDAFPNPGRAISKHWHARKKHFYQTLQGFDRSIWPILAIPCAVYERRTVRSVLDAWIKGVDGDVHLPANAREAA